MHYYEGQLPILSTVSQQIVAWCDVQQPGQQINPVPGAGPGSQPQLQLNQALTLLSSLLADVYIVVSPVTHVTADLHTVVAAVLSLHMHSYCFI